MKRVTPIAKVKKGWLLCRVSSLNQGNVQHGSNEQQGHFLKRSVNEINEKSDVKYKIVRIIEETKSGRRTKYHLRTAPEETLAAIRSGSIDFVAFEKIRAMGRWARKNIEIIETAFDYDCEVFLDGKKYNHLDKGDRIKFGIENLMAEEESNDNSERVTKKQREAMVNNGKDSSSVPSLGLDAHPTRTCMYVWNDKELEIVIDIMKKFCELKSKKATVEYCREKNYQTKTRMTKERVDKDGVIHPPRQIGGEFFNERRLTALLLNPRYCGHSYFKDTFNQFPKLQNSEGFVRWEYHHYRSQGSRIDFELLQRVEETLKEIAKGKRTKKSKNGAYPLLTGILKGWDGSKFEADFSRVDHKYYRNNKLKIHIRKEEVEKVIVKRIKQYLKESGTLKRVLQATLKHRLIGLPFIDEEIRQIKTSVKDLEAITLRFSETLRETALAGTVDLADVCKQLTAEKEKAEVDLEKAKEQLRLCEKRKDEIKRRFEDSTAEDWLRKVFQSFGQETDLKKKRLVQAIIPEIILHEDNKLELRINPDPEGKVAPDWASAECDGGGQIFEIGNKWRGGRDSNPRPPA